MIDLSVIIVSFNTKKLLVNCLESVEKYTEGVNYEVIVVDNNSTDGSVELIKNAKLKIIENRENLGFSRANNQGMRVARGRYILLLNSDTKLYENSLTKMVEWMNGHKKVGIATCKLLNPDGSTQPNGGYFPHLFRVFLWSTFLDDLPFIGRIFGAYHSQTKIWFLENDFYNKEHEQDWATAAFIMMRSSVFKDLGGFDESFFMYAEDVDFCYRVRKKGWEVWYVPTTSITHIGSASGGGGIVHFISSTGKEGGILGEFSGLKKFYKKHYSPYELPILFVLLKVAALLRLVLFGILGRQKEAAKVYAKAFITA